MLKLVIAFCILGVSLALPQFAWAPIQQAAPQPTIQVAPQGVPVATSAQLTAAAAPAVPQVPPANFVSGSSPDGSTVFGFQTLDGQTRSESHGADGSVRGSYSFVDPHGKPVTVHYVADQQGFRTSQEPIPAAPPTTTPPPAPQPPPQQHLPILTFQLPVQHAAPAPATPAPAPVPVAAQAPAAVQSFTPFFSPLPAASLPLSHFGFQPLAAATPAPAPVPVPQPAAAPAQQLNPIAYSFNTGR